MHDHHTDHHHKAFNDPEAFAKHHANADRDNWQKTELVIEAMGIQPYMTVIEIGPGTGYFALRIANILSEGQFIGIETSRKMADYLEEALRKKALNNTDIQIVSENEIPNLHEKGDIIFCVNVYHHIPNRVQYFSQLKNTLKDDGRLIIIDLTENAPFGPPPEYRISERHVIEEMKQAGLDHVDAQTIYLDYQYFLEFKETKKSS